MEPPAAAEPQEPHAIHKSILAQFMTDSRTRNMRQSNRQQYSVHVAVLMRRGKTLATAMNRNGSRSSGSGYSDRSIHAERNVIKELGDISKLRGASMLVMRIGRGLNEDGTNRFLPSVPCRDCQLFLEKMMREHGLKNVFYTATGALG